MWKIHSTVAFLLLFSGLTLQAQAPLPREYQLKAVFLFNFTHFVEWPADSFLSDQSPMIIGIIGKNPFGSYLEEAVADEKVNGHPVVVQYYNNIEDIKTCHILFINLTDTKKQKQAIDSFKEKNILTVSDSGDFLKQGGMIRFFTMNNKIKLQINLAATKAAELVLSSKLLSLAEIIE